MLCLVGSTYMTWYHDFKINYLEIYWLTRLDKGEGIGCDMLILISILKNENCNLFQLFLKDSLDF